MKNVFKDLKRYSKGSFLKGISNILFNPNFHCVVNYRIAHFLNKKLKFNIVPKIIMYINRIYYSVDIDYRSKISGGFKLIHGIGTVIGSKVVIEENVTIYQNVTLGGNMNKANDFNGTAITQPHICKNTTLYAASMVIGGVIVGENVEIGANTVITKNVESNTKVFSKCQITVVEKDVII